ncbi:esterase family protein [bacterium]|nr:esterase family protein [bacterium]
MKSHFRTIEISDPRFEFEGLRWVTVKSPALKQRADITLFVPKQAANSNDLPLIILMHGVYGSHWAWALKGGAHRTAQRMIDHGTIPPMVIAMPSDGLWGDGSCYVPHGVAEAQRELRSTNPDFEKWIVEDVPAAAREAVPSVTNRSPQFIAGLSMGGFGALRIGAKYPEMFRAISGHSSATHFEQLEKAIEEPLASYGCAAANRSALETILQNRDRLPPLRFDCGVDDFLIELNRSLHTALEEEGVPHIYEEFPGAHTWPYWEKHLEETLRFFTRQL